MSRSSLIAAVVALALAFPIGLWLGLLLKGKHALFWTVAAIAGLGAAAGVFYFKVSGPSWLVAAPIGAVAGLWTGMKYGYLDSLLGIFTARGAVEGDAEDGVEEGVEVDAGVGDQDETAS